MSRAACSKSSAALAGAPRARPAPALLDATRNLRVDAQSPEGEVSGPLLRIDHDSRQTPVQLPPPSRVGGGIDARGEERVHEPDLLLVSLENLRLERRTKNRPDASSNDALQELERWLRDRRNGQQRVSRPGRQSGNPLGHQRGEVGRQGNRLIVRPAATQLASTRELEREERIPTRDLIHAPKDRSRKRHAKMHRQQPVDRPKRERPKRERPKHGADHLVAR